MPALQRVVDGIAQQDARLRRPERNPRLAFERREVVDFHQAYAVRVHELERAVWLQDLDAIGAAVQHAEEKRVGIRGCVGGWRVDRVCVQDGFRLCRLRPKRETERYVGAGYGFWRQEAVRTRVVETCNRGIGANWVGHESGAGEGYGNDSAMQERITALGVIGNCKQALRQTRRHWCITGKGFTAGASMQAGRLYFICGV